MNRKASTLLSLVLSLALIAGTLWFLHNYHNSFGFGKTRWILPHHMTMGDGGMWVIMILFFVAVITAIAMVVSGVVTGRRSEKSPDNWQALYALEILETRYALGEIDKAQYQTMKQELGQS